jgi:hypothetical protein
MADVPNMGTPYDMSQREFLLPVDDDSRQSKILKVRKLIYKYNYTVNSLQVQSLLKEESLVPTMVTSPGLELNVFRLTSIECIFRETLYLQFQSFHHACC